MLLEIVEVGDPVLRHPARNLSVDEIRSAFVQELISSMRLTMHEAPGVGLAAPQVGEPLQLAVVEDDGPWLEDMSDERREELGRQPLPFTVLVNPELEPVGDETAEQFEGCLSLPGHWALVRRWHHVRVRALDERGEPFVLEAEGWPARILQHELDHLAGTLYVDRMETRSFTTSENLSRWWKARPADEVRRRLDEG